MNRLLLAIGGLLVGLLAILFAAPAMVDWNRYRGIFEEEATRFLGREVRVGGAVNLRLLPIPYVRFEKVRVADMTANVGRPLFQADDFTVWLSVGSLLAGKFEASEIELRKPVVTLVLDGQGGGSWSSLAQRGPAGIAPAHVSFDSVRITDGTVTIVGADSVPRASFDRIDGELSAQALNGPYRLSAAFSSAGAAREIRLSTAQAAEDGSVRFKGTVRAPASGVSYSLDGLATDPLGQIKVTGALTAKLPLPAAMAASASGDAKPGTTDALNAASQFDVSAELRGDTSGFALSELSLSFEQAGRPQLATGSARVNWTGRTLVTVALKSQWLDLDRIAGAGTGGTPLELTQGVAASLSRVLASGGRTEASLEIEQATLGGDIVSGLTASLVESDGQLEVRNLSAALPGGARLSASGTFKGDMPDLGYSGRLSLRGASLARFAGWAGKSHAIPLPQRDGPFALVGDVTLGRSELAGRSLTIEVGRSVLSGDASWRGGPARQISLSLEGSELDLSSLVQAETDPARALSEIIAGFAGQRSPLVEAVASSNAAVKLRIDRLVLGSSAFTDVLAELRIADGALTMPMLRLASGEGYAVELKGDIAGLARPGAKGVLTGLVSANSAEGLAALVGLAGLPADLVRREENAALVVPVRLAGRMQVGLKGPNTLELTLDGSLAASRLAGTLRLGASGTSWRERQTDVAMTIEGPEVPRLIGRSLGGQSRAIERSARPARVSVRSIGTPRSGMTVLATIDGNGTAAAYQGRASIDDSGSLGLDGEAELSLADLADGLSLAGLSPRPSLDGPVAGSIRIERKAAVAKLASTGLKIANSMLAGTMTIESAADANRISGQLKLGEAGLSGLLALLSAQRPGAREAPARRSVWSESPLDLSLSDQFAGSALRFDVARLSVAPGLEIADARVELAAKPGRVEARLTDGNALGGKATATLSLEKAAAGAHLMSKGALAGIKLERLSARPGTSPSASGTLSARIEVQSTALSSRGLVVALTGSGEASLAQARLERWTPAAVGTAAEAVLALKGEIPPGALRTQLELALQAAGVSLGSQKVALTVADGALRAAPLVVSAPLGRLTGRAAVDLDQLLLDAEWRIEPRNTPPSPGLPPKAELPGIGIGYQGPLASLPSLERRLDIEALEREIAVRKVEREVAELERLRRLDEERARQEAARLEAERLEAEQRLAERLRLERLQQGIGAPSSTPGAAAPATPPAAARPAPAIPGPSGALPGSMSPSTGVDTGSAAQAPGPGITPEATAATATIDDRAALPAVPSSALPSASSQPAGDRPAPSRPPQSSAASKTTARGNPFGALREGSP